MQYILIGLLLMLNGLGNLEDHAAPALLNILIGASLIVVFLLIKMKKLRRNYLEPIALTAEGTGLLIAGYIYFKNGSDYLPYISYLAGTGYFIAVLIKSRKKLRPI